MLGYGCVPGQFYFDLERPFTWEKTKVLYQGTRIVDEFQFSHAVHSLGFTWDWVFFYSIRWSLHSLERFI